ncbi:MAG TPA: hypothetical protein EYP61_01210 [Candidatus Latescibacteria bacterium]|nr:hypothetical protein [Candidatus Latescibacterota bacterium]
MLRKGIRVGRAEIGVSTNSPSLLGEERFFWLNTNFRSVEFLPYSGDLDGFVEIWDRPNEEAGLEVRGRVLRLEGDFAAWEEEAEDRRYTLFGNLGIFSPWALRIMEEAHSVHTLHACGLYRDGELTIVLGGPGAGKTVFLLCGIEEGWRVFSTEFLHFCAGDRVKFFKGSLRDPVRAETLLRFPKATKLLKVKDIGEEAGGKMVVDFSPFSVPEDVLAGPEVRVIFSHVEERRERIVREEMKKAEAIERLLFQNASEKLGKGGLLYRSFPFPGFDNFRLAKRRHEDIKRFLGKASLKECVYFVAGIDDVRTLL